MNQNTSFNKPGGGFNSVQSLLDKYKTDDRDKYISREFQKYGYDLAREMHDPDNVALYIKLAKTTDRTVLEKAKSFVRDAPNVKNKTALFLWKMKELKNELKNKRTEEPRNEKMKELENKRTKKQ
ncbi:MAG TPA: hypothetical protein VF985_06660 [Mariniflexile sp.]